MHHHFCAKFRLGQIRAKFPHPPEAIAWVSTSGCDLSSHSPLASACRTIHGHPLRWNFCLKTARENRGKNHPLEIAGYMNYLRSFVGTIWNLKNWNWTFTCLDFQTKPCGKTSIVSANSLESRFLHGIPLLSSIGRFFVSSFPVAKLTSLFNSSTRFALFDPKKRPPTNAERTPNGRRTLA